MGLLDEKISRCSRVLRAIGWPSYVLVLKNMLTGIDFLWANIETFHLFHFNVFEGEAWPEFLTRSRMMISSKTLMISYFHRTLVLINQG